MQSMKCKEARKNCLPSLIQSYAHYAMFPAERSKMQLVDIVKELVRSFLTDWQCTQAHRTLNSSLYPHIGA